MVAAICNKCPPITEIPSQNSPQKKYFNLLAVNEQYVRHARKLIAVCYLN